MAHMEIEVDSLPTFLSALDHTEDPKETYFTPALKARTTLPSKDGEDCVPVKLDRCEVLYNNREVMAVGFGNTKKQADRNASIKGLQWLEANRHFLNM